MTFWTWVSALAVTSLNKKFIKYFGNTFNSIVHESKFSKTPYLSTNLVNVGFHFGVTIFLTWLQKK